MAARNPPPTVPTEKEKEPSTEIPVTQSYIYLRVQPFTTSYVSRGVAADAGGVEHDKLQFVLHLIDPGHSIVHSAVTQAIPAGWLAIWDQHNWVEDSVVDVLKVGVEVLGQEYIATRMSWTEAPAEAESEEEEEDEEEEEEKK
jgi:hypothetical protein